MKAHEQTYINTCIYGMNSISAMKKEKKNTFHLLWKMYFLFAIMIDCKGFFFSPNFDENEQFTFKKEEWKLGLNM